jgi:hypothetical protein
LLRVAPVPSRDAGKVSRNGDEGSGGATTEISVEEMLALLVVHPSFTVVPSGGAVGFVAAVRSAEEEGDTGGGRYDTLYIIGKAGTCPYASMHVCMNLSILCVSIVECV